MAAKIISSKTLSGKKPNSGRDKIGRFAKGNPGGGRHKGSKDRAARYRAEVEQGVKDGDLADVIAAMVERGKSGDVQAARLVLEYTLGRPRGTDALVMEDRAELIPMSELEVIGVRYAKRILDGVPKPRQIEILGNGQTNGQKTNGDG